MTNENKLAGLRVLNTRPQEQGRALSESIYAAGGISIELPGLAIEPTAEGWLKNLPNLENIRHAIFISTNAVKFFFHRLVQQKIKWPTTINTIAIGNASANALAKWGIRIDHVPNVADSEHLLELDMLQHITNQTILLVQGEGGRMELTNTLLNRGAKLTSLAVYRRALPQVSQQELLSLWREDSVDIILFTSQQAMQNIFTLFGKHTHDWLRGKPCLVISERLANAAALLGMQTIITSRHDLILNSLKLYNKERALKTAVVSTSTKE